MNPSHHLFVLTCLLLAQGAWAAEAADERWVEIASTDKAQWLGKKGSGDVANLGKQKGNAYSYVYQVSNKKDKTYEYKQLFVELSSCKKSYGYVYYNGMDGEFLGKDGFVRFGTTVADALGSMACTSWDQKTGKVSRADQGDTWEVVASAAESGNKYALKADTVRKTAYNNKPAVAALYSYEDVKNKTVTYGEYVFPLADCKRGFGVAYSLNFDGELLYKSDIALDGDSVLSATISALCAKL
jgi:hypothetical protein